MALIECPECGGQVSDRAPACPHCGVPVANGTRAETSPTASASKADDQQNPSAATAQGSHTASFADPAEPIEPFRFRIAGRPIPVAGVLFWGGMVVGITIKLVVPPEPDVEPELWRRLPWLMIWAGVLWFAVTELGALIRNRVRKR